MCHAFRSPTHLRATDSGEARHEMRAPLSTHSSGALAGNAGLLFAARRTPSDSSSAKPRSTSCGVASFSVTACRTFACSCSAPRRNQDARACSSAQSPAHASDDKPSSSPALPLLRPPLTDSVPRSPALPPVVEKAECTRYIANSVPQSRVFLVEKRWATVRALSTKW